ncbi:AhpC/TSA family protein [Arcticibacter pallidicorallinus]|uniref:AhpC/TSA family protein n=1 Tax=Arcticibacter pallidicorallinus TaxID=1259464 RepID=A0A2T0UC77_9SPHI|nr:redoxin domain-containing protein [Arcticibacter pallidicorallinus]PRY55417.1 AhpC/TSA family protein [Arcticibacter pallidicorallinus]
MKLPLIIVSTLLLFFAVPANAQTPAREIPNFTFFTVDGNPFASSQIPKGRPSVFSFFDVTCTHCKSTMKTLGDRYPDLRKASVYLVTLDGRKEALDFVKKHGPQLLNKPNVTILIDLNKEFLPKFQPQQYPSVYVYNKYRRLELYEKDERKIPHIFEKIKSL